MRWATVRRGRGRALAPALAAGVLLLASPGSGSAAPLGFNTALPVARGELVFRGQVIAGGSGDDPGPGDRELSSVAAVSVLGYGVTPRLAVFGVLPRVDRELEVTAGGARRHRKASGLGDIALFGRHTLFRRDGPGRSFRVAPFLGVEAPTGDDDAHDALGRLPPGVQPGSGAWDLFGGVVATWQTLRLQLDVQASYRANGEANGFEAGDVARLDGSLQYRLWPRRLGRGVPAFLYGVLEVGLAHEGRNHEGGREDPDSGGTRLFLTPGLQYVTRRWILEGGVQLPVVQDLNGLALERGPVVRAGFRVNF